MDNSNESYESSDKSREIPAVTIRESVLGDAGYISYLHGRYYGKYYNFVSSSEYYFIKYLADFVKDPSGGKLFIAEVCGEIAGSSGIVRVNDNTAQFRWFIVDEKYQGMGIGSRLIKTALDFCRLKGYENVFLWTFKGLDRARALYEKNGFVLTEEKPNNVWSTNLIIEQKLEAQFQSK